MRFRPTPARAALAAALVGGLSATHCGARSDLTASGGSSGAGTTSAGGTAGGVAGRGGSGGTSGSMGASGTLGASGSMGASGADGGECPSDLQSNPKHCGRCNLDCEGGECRGGSCMPVTIAVRAEGATALALDETFVYWARPIMRAPKLGGEATVLSTDTPDAVWGIAVDQYYVFWGSPTYGPVRRVLKIGRAPAEALTRDSLGANRIAVDTSGVYFTSHGLYRMKHDGSSMHVLPPEGDTGIALDSEFVYFTSRIKGEVYRISKDGLGLTVLATAPLAHEVAVHGEFVVFNAQGDELVRRVPRNGGAAQVIGSGSANGVTVDADGVYFTGADSVAYVPIEGFPRGDVLFIASNQESPRAIATDETRVFWTTDPPRSRVMKVVKSGSIKQRSSSR